MVKLHRIQNQEICFCYSRRLTSRARMNQNLVFNDSDVKPHLLVRLALTLEGPIVDHDWKYTQTSLLLRTHISTG